MEITMKLLVETPNKKVKNARYSLAGTPQSGAPYLSRYALKSLYV